ncbi:MAG: glutamyl-tRNA reductase [Sedimentisphaerales bacterium]|nr:glutamyl-tRNA reductase [Sedimentisphaerales bacterium]
MQIILAGLNHKTAPVDIRGRLAFGSQETIDALARLKQRHPDGEFILLSTCNRVELYCAVKDDGSLNAEDLLAFLSEIKNIDTEEFKDFFYILYNEEAARHLLMVTASLDSMVVGESQITAQVKESFRLANRAGSFGKVLSRLFHCAFATSKEIYTKTSIASGRVSVAGVAVELARQLFEDIKSAKIKIIGAGQMGDLLIEHFLHIKSKNITVINRSEHKGGTIAGKHEVLFDRWENLTKHLCEANIVVGAATTTQGYLFDKDEFKKVMNRRKGKTLLIIDIAVPRIFDPRINDIENVYLYSVDDLGHVAEENVKAREGDIEQAVEIICQKTSEFVDWLETKDIGPLIGRIKIDFERIRQNEMERFFVGERKDAYCREVMEQTVSRVINKLLHCVIKNIDVIAKEHGIEDAKKFASSIVAHAEEIISEDIEKNLKE